MTAAAPHPLVVRFCAFIKDLREAVADCGGRRVLAGPLTVRLWGRLGRIAVLFAAMVAHLAAGGVDAPRRVCRKRQVPPAPRTPKPPVTGLAAGPAQSATYRFAPRTTPRDLPEVAPEATPPDPPEPAAAAASPAAPLFARPPAAPWAVPWTAPPATPPAAAPKLRLPGHRAWLCCLCPGGAAARSRMQHLLEDPEMRALLAASPRLMALVRPLFHILGVVLPAALQPPKPPRKPRKPRPRRWQPPRRGDLHLLLRMGKPIPGT